MIGIVILNYLNWKDTINCVKSIRDTCKSNYKIYIVDNASSNDSKVILNKEYNNSNDVVVIAVEINKGYSAGNNIGIKQALKDGCDQVLISNSDVFYYNNTIDKMSDFLYKTPDAGIVAPKTLDREGKPYYFLRRNLNLKDTLLGTTVIGKTPFGRKAKNYYLYNDLNVNKLQVVDVVQGCCFLMKKELIEKIGLFDENTFLYAEEFILAKKVSNTYYKTYFYPYVQIKHLDGSSTTAASINKFLLDTKSSIYYYKAYLNASTLWCFIYLLLRIIKYIYMVTKDDKSFKLVIKFMFATFKEPFKKVERYIPKT